MTNPAYPGSAPEDSAALLLAQLDDLRQQMQSLHEQLAIASSAAEQARDALALRNAALDAATTQIMIVDVREAQRPIVYANRAIAVQHGYTDPQELLGRSAALLVRNISDGDAYESLRQTLQEGRRAVIETEMTRRDGTRFWVGFSTTPLRNAIGEITHHVTLGADITARREQEAQSRLLQQRLVAQLQERERMQVELQLAQKLESVGRLAAGLAHEINTPIQYVGDSAHFLQDAFETLARLFDAYSAPIAEGVDAAALRERSERLRELESQCDLEFLRREVPRAFERTLEGAERVAGIVRAMREFAYPDAHEHVAADLNHAIETTLLVARSEYKHLARVSTRLGELPAVTCNVGELNQVFLNLIVNAAHAIEDAGKDSTSGLISIATELADREVRVVITDNGCGIDPGAQKKVFDPFYTTKEVGRGTGQGLAIARSIVVDRHGGRIELSSTPGTGSVFTVCLPVDGRAVRSEP